MTIKQRKLCKVSADIEWMVARAKQATGFLKALSHESRLLILCLLSEGEKSVTNLEELLALRQSTVSQQLARLRLDGLVKTKRDGKTIYYNLANEDVRTVLAAIYEVFGKKPKRGAR
ncbi:metalloregulator ArsR/SmtB family transcription factor [Methylocapsa sp. D3K7]|jgi:DNA-binding transcriptional ArsR family regulator|uniref:ArsR/SmtB family transcription factor n=1 Tax=Methylocapsa sp. D3K7 TaxID=3041435 RepID=UPI00244EDA97|nr:metalloregulator ArsR/SmtB family transcription factor [Methylocapsa sp. D3K7]WGJ14531.1 metalloregulator ArsR/SmtB family transcription factor [Methylocapsa sp. D3K7]